VKGRKRAIRAMRDFAAQMFIATAEAAQEGDKAGQEMLTTLGTYCQPQMSTVVQALADETTDADE
jgi:hypothetical protein